MRLEDLKLKLTAVFEAAPEGGYTCHFEELPEVFSEGETIEAARASLLDALSLVEDYHREGAHAKLPFLASREPVRAASPTKIPVPSHPSLQHIMAFPQHKNGLNFSRGNKA